MADTMRAMQVLEQNGELQLVEKPVPTPGPGEAVVKVAACGVCHSDSFAVSGAYGGGFPITPGHEIAGTVSALGEGVHGWEEGQAVGVGWYGGGCGWCKPCRMGALISCENTTIPGVQRDGGYADYVLIPAAALAAIPKGIAPEAAAPLMCAGVTTYNGLRRTGARPGDLVAVLGVGGLGHLGVQYAAKMGFRVAAIARGGDKADLAIGLGAHSYIDSTTSDPAEELTRLGGARVILSTVTNGDAVASVIGGLGVAGELVIVGAAEQPIPVPATALIPTQAGLRGHASGTADDSEDTLAFSRLAGVEAQIETMPLESAQAAYQKMMDGDARFRMVLTL